jgi:hypothetical protein
MPEHGNIKNSDDNIEQEEDEDVGVEDEHVDQEEYEDIKRDQVLGNDNDDHSDTNQENHMLQNNGNKHQDNEHEQTIITVDDDGDNEENGNNEENRYNHQAHDHMRSGYGEYHQALEMNEHMRGRMTDEQRYHHDRMMMSDHMRRMDENNMRRMDESERIMQAQNETVPQPNDVSGMEALIAASMSRHSAESHDNNQHHHHHHQKQGHHPYGHLLSGGRGTRS